MTPASYDREPAVALNVLMVVPWDQHFGGVASVVGNLARSLEQAGHHVVFFHLGEPEYCRRRTTAWGFTGYERNLRSPFIEKYPIRSRVAFLVYLVPTLLQLAAVIRRHRIQVVNVHYPVESFVYFGLLRWLLSIRLAVSVHGADLFPDGRRSARYRWSIRLLVDSADALVAPSRAFLQECLAVFPRAARHGAVVHNGIDVAELGQPDPGAVTSAQPYVLCIAAHNEKKALDVLLAAFAEIGDAHRGVRLLLVGDGPLRAQHEAQARALALNGRVEFMGERGRAEVARLLHGCSIFVLPSRSEPFGVVVTEALACRKAVVATAVGGIPEIIEDGRSGVLVEPDNPGALARALTRMLDDHALRERLADAGYERVLEHFACNRMGAGYERLYSALLA
jgi:glycosyltransferase involved in cell wall biosynthesis